MFLLKSIELTVLWHNRSESVKLHDKNSKLWFKDSWSKKTILNETIKKT